jgi:excisionase family DNA binding protein
MSNNKRMTTTEVAARLGRSVRTVQRLAESGELKYTQKVAGGSNGIYLFDFDVVDKYLADHAELQEQARPAELDLEVGSEVGS